MKRHYSGKCPQIFHGILLNIQENAFNKYDERPQAFLAFLGMQSGVQGNVPIQSGEYDKAYHKYPAALRLTRERHQGH